MDTTGLIMHFTYSCILTIIGPFITWGAVWIFFFISLYDWAINMYRTILSQFP